MASEFKLIEFDCSFKMEIKVTDEMTEKEIIEKIEETFDLVHEYGSSDFDESNEYSAYMILNNIKNVLIPK